MAKSHEDETDIISPEGGTLVEVEDILTPADKPETPRRLIGQLTSAERKQYPMATGLLDYFPDALAYVSHVSWRGNEKHNPGQPLHWARGKSMDHPDCMLRHLTERGALDDAGIEHAGSLAWRALADLQQLLEKKYDLDPPRAAIDTGFDPKA